VDLGRLFSCISEVEHYAAPEQAAGSHRRSQQENEFEERQTDLHFISEVANNKKLGVLIIHRRLRNESMR
jgi:hypothetical protein